MARLRIQKGTAKVQTLQGVSWRVVLSCLMVLTVLVSTFICATNACAAFDGDQAAATQVLDDKTPSAATDPAAGEAPHGKLAGGYASCTGHCAAHALSLPAPLAEMAVFIPTAATWRLPAAVEVALGGPALLERPPRL